VAQTQSSPGSRPSGPCVQAGADSAAIAAAAKYAALADRGDTADALEIYVEGFRRENGGTLVTILPGVLTLGGGAYVWVPDGGCAVVREPME